MNDSTATSMRMRRVWQTRGLAGGDLGETEGAGEVAEGEVACQEEQVKLLRSLDPV